MNKSANQNNALLFLFFFLEIHFKTNSTAEVILRFHELHHHFKQILTVRFCSTETRMAETPGASIFLKISILKCCLVDGVALILELPPKIYQMICPPFSPCFIRFERSKPTRGYFTLSGLLIESYQINFCNLYKTLRFIFFLSCLILFFSN